MYVESPALKNRDAAPTDDMLAQTLQASYGAFATWRAQLAAEGVELQWNYYRDTNAWLGKMLAGRKNIGWLIPYAGYFRTNFFFMERHSGAIAASEIPEPLKAEFAAKDFTTGKLQPLSVRIANPDPLADALTVLRFKKTLK